MRYDPQKQFERDYELYSDAIFRFLYYKVQDRERALELSHDVFARFWQYLALGKTVENPRAFLYRSAQNAFINEIRTNKNTTSLDSMLESGLELVDNTRNVETEVVQREAVEKLKSMDSRYRDVLVMRYVESMAVKEIAQILGEKENTVSVWIKRGLENFKKHYD